MLDRSFVDAIAELEAAKTSVEKIGGHEVLMYNGAILQSYQVRKPAPTTLTVHTLSGLRDYIRENRDSLSIPSLSVHVVSPTLVNVVGATDPETEQRFVHLSAECYDRFAAMPSFRFGSFLNAEAMVIGLMALFAESPDRTELIQILSNIRQGAVRTDTDDGVSQEVTVRHGISMEADKRVPNPVTLQPHRTFVEIVQPVSEFVFRMQASSEAEKAGAALFEADGGAWRDDATQSIAEWLRSELPAGVAVLA